MASEQHVDKTAAENIINFLKKNVPVPDIPSVESELKKDFVFAKRRSKTKKKKPKKQKAKFLTKNEKKKLGFYSIDRHSVKYKDFLPVYAIWTEYMSQILELDRPVPEIASKGWDSFVQSLYKSDFHGSKLRVIRSKCPSYVDKIGICIMDTKNTFKIVSSNDLVTTLPKKECVFEMYLKDMKVVLFGKQLCARPAERSTKKIKAQSLPDL